MSKNKQLFGVFSHRNGALTHLKQGDHGLPDLSIAELSRRYVTGAVHFDGANSSLVNAALQATDGDAVSMSFLFRAEAMTNKALFVTDPQNAYNNYAAWGGSGQAFYFGNTDSSNTFEVEATPNTIFDGGWHHALISINTAFGAEQKLVRVYIDGVDHTGYHAGTHDNGDAFSAAFNGLPFYLGEDGLGEGPVVDLADFWLSTGQSLLDESGDIPLATRRKFFDADGLPVNLGADGSAPTGAPPTIFFHAEPGDEVATFVVNRGTGGAFTLTGSLTVAETSPSDRLDGVPRQTTGLVSGECFATDQNVLVASMPPGSTCAVYNDSDASIELTQDTGMLLRLDATATTGTRTLAAHGMAVVWFNSENEAVAMGKGVS